MKPLFLTSIFILHLLFSPAIFAEPVEFSLVQSGQPAARILVSSEDPVLRAAVQDLTARVKEMSGADLEVHVGTADLPGPTLHIGETELFDDIAALREEILVDGFVMASTGDDLIVAGNLPRGTSNGVMTVLQDHFGVRWYYADPLFTVAPPQEDLTITFDPTITGEASGVIHNPDYLERTIWGGPPNDEFGRHARLTFSEVDLPFVGAGHNLSGVVPPSKYFDSQPEYFALKNGQRNKDHPCYTHPDMPELFMDWLRKGKYSFGVNDNTVVCHCERCQKVDGDSEPYQGMDNVSESYCQLIEKVAKQAAEELPDQRIGIFAYQITNAPPKTVDHLGENVDVVLCQDTAQYFDAEYKRTDNQMAKEWVEKSGHVRMYDYLGISYWTPRYFPTIMAEQLAYLHDIGVNGYGSHFTTSIASSMPMFYLYTQMLWDADLDPDAVIDEMMTNLYGPASEPMGDFYDHWEECWESQTKSKWFAGMDDFLGEMRIFSREDFAEGRHYLDKALALARQHGNKKALERVQYINTRHELTEAAASAYYAAWDAMESRPESPEDAIELSNAVVHAWDHFVKTLNRNKDLPSGYASTWFSKTFRVRAWGLKQLMRDASAAPMVRWSARHEHETDAATLAEAETKFANILERNRIHIEAMLTGSIEANERKPRTDAVQAASIPFVDGSPRDMAQQKKWQSFKAIDTAPWYFRSRPDDPDFGKYQEPVKQFYVDAPAKEDQSVQWEGAWNEDYLYLRIVANDNKHKQNQPAEAMWKEDSIQIGLTPDRENFVYPQHSWLIIWGGYLGPELEFGVSLKDNKTQVAVWQTPEALALPGPEDRIQARARRVGNQTIYEAAIPWRLLPDFEPEDHTSLGISLVVNDVDDGPRRSAEYGSGILHTKRPTEFAAIRLMR